MLDRIDNLLTHQPQVFLYSKKKFLSTLISSIYSNIFKYKKFFFLTTSVKKKRISVYERLFFLYSIKLGLPIFVQRAFILLEMQLNSFLLRVKLVPYFFMVKDLCFYRLILVNNVAISDPFFIVSLFDIVQLPLFLYHYIQYRNSRYRSLPKIFRQVFFYYWRFFNNSNVSRAWLLNNYFHSSLTGQVLAYEYPNIYLYMAPFSRFSKLYFRNHTLPHIRRKASLSYTHSVFKIKLFSYTQFYK